MINNLAIKPMSYFQTFTRIDKTVIKEADLSNNYFVTNKSISARKVLGVVALWPSRAVIFKYR